MFKRVVDRHLGMLGRERARLVNGWTVTDNKRQSRKKLHYLSAVQNPRIGYPGSSIEHRQNPIMTWVCEISGRQFVQAGAAKQELCDLQSPTALKTETLPLGFRHIHYAFQPRSCSIGKVEDEEEVGGSEIALRGWKSDPPHPPPPKKKSLLNHPPNTRGLVLHKGQPKR